MSSASADPRAARVAAALTRLGRSRWVPHAIRLGALALVVWLVLRLVSLWQESPADLSETSVPILALAWVMSLAAVVSYGTVWPLILRKLRAPVPRDAVALFLQSQLGKYLPGSVWHYAGRIGLARSRGVPARATVASLVIELAASVVAAGLFAAFVLPLVFAVPLAIAILVCLVALATGHAERLFDPLLRLARRVITVPSTNLKPGLRTVPLIAALYLPVWALYGAAFWLTGRAMFDIPLADLGYYSAAFALGWLAGIVVIFAPGGIGVREAVLAGLLAPRVGETEAIVIAGASRLLLTAVDLAAGAGALAFTRLELRRRRGGTG